MKPAKKLPPLELVELNYSYDPVTGLVTRLKTGKTHKYNDRTTGTLKIRVGHVTTQVSRIAWLLFYREDPVGFVIEHIDRDPHNNKIDNLRKVKRR